MALDLSSLKKSLEALQRSLNVLDSTSLDSDIQEAVKAGIIHNFKVAFDRSMKAIQCWLRENHPSDYPDAPQTRRDILKMSAMCGLVADPVVWIAYGDARNLTSQTYDEHNADEVYEAAKRFEADGMALYSNLKKERCCFE